MTPVSTPSDIILRLRSLGDWQQSLTRHPELIDPTYLEWAVLYCRTKGVFSDFLGRQVPPSGVTVAGTNYREDLLVGGLNARQRAVLDLLANWPPAAEIHALRLYAQEALTPLALALRGRYPRFLGSEYAATDAQRAALFPVPSEDATGLSFPDGSFDVALTNDVLEHIPDLDRGIAELARVLRPGGLLLASFPFDFNAEATDIRAELVGGGLVHHKEPEYHGNPVDPEGGSLVFQVPGWDVLGRCRAAGFDEAEIVFVSSPGRGILGGGIAGVFILRAVKAGGDGEPQPVVLLPAPLARSYRTLSDPATLADPEAVRLTELVTDLRDFAARAYGGVMDRDAELRRIAERQRAVTAEHEARVLDLEAALTDLRRGLGAAEGGVAERDAEILRLHGLLTEARERIGALEGGAAERDAEILRLHGLLTEARDRIGALEGGVAERDAAILYRNDLLSEARDRIGALEGGAAERDAEIVRLRELLGHASRTLQEAEAGATDLNATLQSLRGSTVWRATAPLRRLARALDGGSRRKAP